MPFKKTNEGWEYDPKATDRIPTKTNLFRKPSPVVIQTDSQGNVDYKKLIVEVNQKEKNEST